MSLNVVFMGSDPIVIPLLESLVGAESGSVRLSAVYAQPDRPQGRGMKLRENPVKAWAVARGIECRQPEKPTPDDATFLRESGCDLLLVMAYGHILKADILAAPRIAALNFHASILPELRGASPIETAIASGRKLTGVTLMRIERRMDAGDACDVETVDIADNDDRASLAGKLALACPPLASRLFSRLAAGTPLPFVPQDESRATFCRILDKEDSNIDFNASARELHDRSRAFAQWPGTSFEFASQRIKIGETALPGTATAAPCGTVLASRSSLDVATSDGVLRILAMQRPGGRMLPAAEFLRGLPIPEGSVLSSLPMRPLERRA